MRVIMLADPARRDIRQIIAETVDETGSVSSAAEKLRLPKSLLFEWIRRLGGRIEKRIRFD